MTASRSARAELWTFLAVAFGGSILLSLAIGLSHGSLAMLAPLATFAPALGVVAALLFAGARLGITWRRFPIRWLPAALFILPLAIHVVTLPAVAALSGRLPWFEWLTPAADGLYHTSAEQGWGTLTLGGLVGRIVTKAIVGLIVVSILVFFEEIGWRAFMLPRLVRELGVPRALVLSALIWAAWHVPFAFGGVQAAGGIPGVWLAVIAPMGHIGAGLFLGCLWLETGSILLVSLAHGALNNWGQFAFKFMRTSGEHDVLLLALVNATVLATGLATFFVMTRRPAIRAHVAVPHAHPLPPPAATK